MVSIINGYVCFTSCDVAAARRGKDAAAASASIPGVTNDRAAMPDSRHPIVFDGPFKDSANASVTSGTDRSGRDVAQQRVNLLI